MGLGYVWSHDFNSEARYFKLVEEMLELGFTWETELQITAEVKDELGDVYLSLLAFAECLGLDLEALGADKLKRLKARTYAQSENGTWEKVPNPPASAIDVTPEASE